MNRRDIVMQACFLGFAGFFTIIFVLVGNKFFNNEVSNLLIGTTILASCLLSAPFFYLLFFTRVGFFGSNLRLSVKNYFLALASFAGVILFIYALASFVAAITNLKI